MVERRVVEYPDVAGDIRTCPKMPVPEAIRMDSDVGDYVARLYAAGAKCRENLMAVDRALGR